MSQGPDGLGEAADHNLAAAWGTLGRHAGFDIALDPTVTLVSSGLPIALFNGAFVWAPAEHPDDVVDRIRSFFDLRGVPYLIWVRQGVDGDLLDAGRRAGLKDAGGPPLQVMAPIVAAPPPPPELNVTLARTRADVEAHRQVMAAGFDMPPEVAHRVLGATLVDDEDVAIAIGWVDGVPVATALLARSGTTAGVYNVATHPAHRSRGYGAAVTWAVVDEGARRGCDHSVLQASDAGYPVYRRMGFADAGRYVQLLGPPAA